MKYKLGLCAIFSFFCLQPAYSLDESDFLSALVSAGTIRALYAEKIAVDGQAPENLAELGLDETYFQTDLVEHIDIDPVSGAIMLGLDPEFGQNEWVALIPEVSNFQVQSWACQTTVSEELVASSGCTAEQSYENITQVLDQDLFLSTVLQITTIRLNAEESVLANGRFPQSMVELGVDEDWLRSANVSNVVVMPYFNTILFALEDVYGVNQWVSYRPRSSRGSIYYWSCKTTLPNTIANVSGCSTSVAVDNLIW